MSVARGFGLNGKSIYMNVAKPQIVECNFIIDSANGNGLGIRSLKSNGYIENVFMHTSTTPGSNNGFLNPNPLAGFAVIQFKNNFNYYLGGFTGFVSPVTGSIKIDNGATLTLGQAYVISTLGNATAAQWLAVGVPPGITPAVGVSFIAIATGGGSGNTSTSRVSTPTVSGIAGVEVVGDPNASIANSSIASNAGARLLVQFLGASLAGSALATHTHDFTVIGGQAASTTNDIANYAGPLLGKQEAANATYVGANSATNGGVIAASAGTPAGSISFAKIAPADNSVCGMSFWFDGSSVTVDGL